jgi:hypothetical protein
MNWLRRTLAAWGIVAPDDWPYSVPPEDALAGLTPELRDTLADLHGTPPAIAETILQLVPYADRPALEAAGVIVPGPQVGHGYQSLLLNDYGLDVIAIAYAARERADR